MPNRISILIVDDEDSVRDSLYNWFIDDGYRVDCAENAKKALSLLNEKEYDIVLADIKMPGMDGMEMHRRIKGTSPCPDCDYHDSLCFGGYCGSGTEGRGI